MAQYSKLKFSNSTNGRAIKIIQTATPGNGIHQAVSGVNDYDEIWLYATNNHTANLNLTIEFGGTLSPDDIIQVSVPFKSGLYLILPGLLLNNSSVVRAYASSANLITVTGWVNRITA